MRKRVSSEKGVTLITLVVTIIVLIILAGVSIASLVGDDGILNEANAAKNEAEMASEEEEITLAFNRAKLRKLKSGETSIVTVSDLESELLERDIDFSSVEEFFGNSELKIIMKNGNEHIINQDGEIVGIYGTAKDVTSTDQQYFDFTVDDTTNTATITGINSEFTGNGAYYNSNTYASVIVDSNGDYITDIAIPYEVTKGGKTYTVTRIEDNAFMVGTNEDVAHDITVEKGFTSIKIPNTVTSIGSGAFLGNMELTKIVIPNSVTTIGDRAFSECRKLKSVVIPENITTIGEHTFYWCTSLVNVKMPSSVTSIGSGAFNHCTSLINITIPNSVKIINGYTFGGCSSLSNIVIPNGVTSIGSGAFIGCSKLKSIVIPNTVTSIGQEAFGECDTLSTITMPSSVTSVEKYILRDCDKLTDIYCEVESKPSGWDSSWNTHCNATVHWNSKSSSVYSNASAVPTDTKYFTFSANTDTKTATLTGINEKYLLSQTYYNNGSEEYYVISTYYDSNEYEYITDIVIPYEVEVNGVVCTVNAIGSRAFESGTKLGGGTAWGSPYLLRSIEIPNTITTIGEYAFQNCTALTEITIPSSVTDVGYGIFHSCTNLKYVYCKSSNIPSTWHSSWNADCDATVLMGQ